MSTVPAPTMASGTSAAIARKASNATGVRSVTSSTGKAAFDQRPGQRHRVGRPLDGEDGNDGRAVGDGGNVHDQTLQPPSITFTVPVVKVDSSLAR